MPLPAQAAPPMSEKAIIGRATMGATARVAQIEAHAPSLESRTNNLGARNTPLDLRPPTLETAPGGELPSRSRAEHSGEDDRLASLGAAMNQEQPSTRAQAFIQRFHREGLPLARLWQSHTALVSVGLNPRGKPGIWWVTQTH